MKLRDPDQELIDKTNAGLDKRQKELSETVKDPQRAREIAHAEMQMRTAIANHQNESVTSLKKILSRLSSE